VEANIFFKKHAVFP